MTIDTIRRAFNFNPPPCPKLQKSNELSPLGGELFKPEQIISRGMERATQPGWIEQLIGFFSSLFGGPSRESKRSIEVQEALSDISENYHKNQTVLHKNGDYQIEKNTLGEIVLCKYQYEYNLKQWSFKKEDVISYKIPFYFATYAWVGPVIDYYEERQLVRKEVKTLVRAEHLADFLTANKMNGPSFQNN